MNLLEAVYQAIDLANSQDPEQVVVSGRTVPAELHYGQTLTKWLSKLYAESSMELKIAVRAQHLKRWELKRSAYPMDRIGYLTWRSELAKFHAKECGSLLAKQGFDLAFIERVASLIRKERLKVDPEAGALEDSACLTFMELELEPFIRKHQEEKVISILKKTWQKMTPVGQEAAKTFSPELSQEAQRLIHLALLA